MTTIPPFSPQPRALQFSGKAHGSQAPVKFSGVFTTNSEQDGTGRIQPRVGRLAAAALAFSASRNSSAVGTAMTASVPMSVRDRATMVCAASPSAAPTSPSTSPIVSGAGMSAKARSLLQ